MLGRIFPLALVLVIGSCSPAAAAPPPVREIESLLAQSAQARVSGDLVRAEQLVLAACRRYPGSWQSHYELALLYLARLEPDSGRAALSRSLALKRNAPALVAMSNLTAASGDLPLATDLCREALALAPAQASAHYAYALLLARQGYQDQADEEFLRAHALDPGDSAMALAAAVHALKLGRARSGLDILAKVQPGTGQSARLAYVRGLLQAGAGQGASALVLLRLAGQLNSGDPLVYEALATTYGASRDWDSAYDAAQSLVSCDPDNVNCQYLKGWYALCARDTASTALSSASKLLPGNPLIQNLVGIQAAEALKIKEAKTAFAAADCHLNLAMLALLEGAPERGLAELRGLEGPAARVTEALARAQSGDLASAESLLSAVSPTRQGLDFWLASGEVDLRAGRYLDAQVKFKKAEKLAPDNPYVLCCLAQALRASGRYEEAFAAVQSAQQLAPASAAVKREMALVLYGQGNFDGAAMILKEYVVKFPLDYDMRMLLATACQKNEELHNARRHFQLAAKQRPQDPAPLVALSRLALKEEEPELARQLARQALALDPGNAAAADALALAARALKVRRR